MQFRQKCFHKRCCKIEFTNKTNLAKMIEILKTNLMSEKYNRHLKRNKNYAKTRIKKTK